MMCRPGLLLLILFCTVRCLAIDAVVAHAVFYLPNGLQKDKMDPYMEASWQLNPKTLHYNTNAQKEIFARIKTDIVIYDNAGIIKEDHYVLQTVPRASLQELQLHSIIELKKYIIKPGFVKIKLLLTDLADSMNRFSYTDTFTVRPSAMQPFYSDLQLLDTIIASDAQSPFKKNGRQQIPACANFLDEHTNILHYYAELYGAIKTDEANQPLVQTAWISRNEDEDIYATFQRKDTITAAAVTLVSGSFPIASLPSGNYYVRQALENKAHVVIASRAFFFQRLNTHPAPFAVDTAKKEAVSDTGMENVKILNLKKTFIAKYSLGEVRAILKMLLPFSDPGASQTIRGFLKKPDEVYMRYYIYNYFLNLNRKEPEKAFKEFSEKIIEVNKQFNSGNTLGYETERGFIYLRYGPPTDIITVENENGSLPYEVWQYNTLVQMNRKEITNAVFLFYKPNQITADFTLLHSTVGGEVQNAGWRSYLYVGGSGDNTNSRAEQYLGNR